MTESIISALAWAKKNLLTSDTPDLDARLLLSHVLSCAQSHLFAYPEQPLTQVQWQVFQSSVMRRQLGEPVAYIVGEKTFYDLTLRVTPDVLIPRPETELLVDWALERWPADKNCMIADIGTGSGAIACAIAHARPNWQVVATDISADALAVAKKNGDRYLLKNIQYFCGEGLDAVSGFMFDTIISNPPYIAADDGALLALTHEPRNALVAESCGHAVGFSIIERALDYLHPGGWLALEHGNTQAADWQAAMRAAGFESVRGYQDLARHERVCVGRKHAS